ncbi:MAG: hypothetical protein KJ614_06040 [Gammaproteobacteria bacterium]|uniref:hypothetical protein n=1 Tax=Rhodoferax sp. TaxID=50421 RepID=UPI00182A26A9|nr:hypothetical protein [Rhodoferax sp.]MBU3898479.1 hypothetical protein [Gammaproteobacteria bacterium]MBA3058506.1 hypothetical protein [Rhodoferax sp.]MBU3997806.1 hypothetical protein [Gammaproteobacteria bacterium]MBU4079253.1 hypothetical protein [Gammaproteobacteria bacterium]MBU4112198.1 hypothetical protein [Gammaproteobacteria bacterium]
MWLEFLCVYPLSVYPLIRSRNGNLSAGLVYDDKTLQDKIDATTYSDKKAQVVTASQAAQKLRAHEAFDGEMD